jgi:hypothetical protein
MRLASGLPAATVARAEGVPEAEVASLLAEPDFADLLAAYRSLAALPREERVARLAKLAWHVLELALADGDVRAAIFVAATVRSGRDPAEALAEAVVTACERAAEPPPLAPPPTPLRPFRPMSAPRDPVPGIVAGAATRARNLLAAEHEAVAPAPSAATPRRPLTRRPPVPKPRAWRRCGGRGGCGGTGGGRARRRADPRAGSPAAQRARRLPDARREGRRPLRRQG